MPNEGQSLILAGAIISIAVNPLLFKAVEPLQQWIRSKSDLARRMERPEDPLAELPMSTDHAKLSGQVVLVGCGRVQNRERVEELRKQGVTAVAGDGGQPAVLIQAHIVRAAMLVVTTPDTARVRAMIETARALNPGAATARARPSCCAVSAPPRCASASTNWQPACRLTC